MKRFYLALLLITFLCQWLVPAKMIYDREDILSSGRVFKFKTRPVDPSDPFRGKYIVLRFEVDRYSIDSLGTWHAREPIFVQIANDDDGFAEIVGISTVQPQNDRDFVRAAVRYTRGPNGDEIWIQYPFERFYLEESKAPIAEEVYRKAISDSKGPTYALIRIKEGRAAIVDVFIGERSILEVVQEAQEPQ